MRIKHKYKRNRAFKIKAWKRVRSLENPYESTNLWYCWTREQQVEENLKRLLENSWKIDKGSPSGYYPSAPADFRRLKNQQFRAKERVALTKINQGYEDVSFPKFVKNADWDWF